MIWIALPPVLLCGVFLAVRLSRSYALGAELVVIAYLASTIAVEPMSFLAGDFNIFVEDLLGALLLSAALFRFLSNPSVRRQLYGWMPFAVATFAAFAFGSTLHGLKAAGVEYRSFFYLSAAALFCASFPLGSRQMKRLVAVWLMGAALLMGIAWFRWLCELLQLPIAEQWALVGGGNRIRVLNASQAFYLGQALIAVIYLRRHSIASGLLGPFAVALGGTVLLLQHRSVWIAVLVAAAAMAWHEGYLRRFLRTVAIVLVLAAVAYALAPEDFTRSNSLAESLERSVEEPFSAERSTFTWRIGVWGEYLLEFAALPPWQMLVGTGLGNPGLYRVGVSEGGQAAHNYFIFLLNRAGFAGLLALCLCYRSLVRRVRGSGGQWDYLGMLLTLVVSQLVYFTVYSPSYDQGLWIGAAFGIASGGIASSGIAPGRSGRAA